MQVIISSSRNSRVIGTALAEGVGVEPIAAKSQIRVLPTQNIAIYGLLRGLLKCWERARHHQLNWLYLDNGYFKPGHFKGYYSATWNAFQHTGAGEYERGKERFEKLNLGFALKEWRKQGEYVLIFPPTEAFAGLQGFAPDVWLNDTIKKLNLHTDRSIKIRAKPGSMLMGKKVPVGASLEEDVSKAYAVVTYNSKAAIQAILDGVPVFTSTPNCTYSVGLDDISQIEHPLYVDDRERWLYALAANQFTLEEMKSGYLTRVLKEDQVDCRTEIPPSNKELEIYFT